MTILDKLVEKKDIKAYVIVRKKLLRSQLRDIKKFHEQNRHLNAQRIEARMKELDLLVQRINNLKDYSKRNW